MSEGNQIRLAALAVVALGAGFLVGRFLPAGARLRATVSAVHTASPVPGAPSRPVPGAPSRPAPGAETAPAATPPAGPSASSSAREERLAEIERELSVQAPDETEALRSLAAAIQQERGRIAELRARLQANDRAWLLENGRGTAPGEAGRRLNLERRLLALSQELADAKAAWREQKRLLDLTFGAPGDTVIAELRAELARRAARVGALERSIGELFSARSGELAGADAVKASRLRALREERAGLEAAYGDAVLGLEDDSRAYQALAAESAERRRRTQSLEAEKRSLENGR
jgi:hypothetical protein